MTLDEQLERQVHWEKWREAYYDGIAEGTGLEAATKGAQRRFGDFLFNYDFIDDEALCLWLVTEPNTNLPQIHKALYVRWQEVEPTDAASAMIGEWRRLKADPLYVLTKRALEQQS